MARKKSDEKESIDIGLGGLFRGLGGLVDLVSKLAEEGGELSRKGELGGADSKGVKAVYGFSIRVGGDGKPIVEQFGNVKSGPGPGPAVEEVREPIVDVFNEDDHLLLVAELPGVAADEVRFEVKEDVLVLTAAHGERKYRKEVLLASEVDVKRASPSYRNGVFELKLPKRRTT